MTASWLVKDDVVLASLEVASTAKARAKGLLGRNGIDDALLLSPCRSVHTFGMRFAIDVAFCTAECEVLAVVTLVPNRASRVHWRARQVIEAEAGSFARWGVVAGDRLELR